MQEDFYRDVVCNRNSPHRYWGIVSEDEFKRHSVGYDYPAKKGKLLGMGGLTNIEWENSQAEISVIIDPTLQRQGYGKEAVHLLLDQAFNYLNLELVYGECYLSHEGFRFWHKVVDTYKGGTASIRKGKLWDGKRYGTLYFDVSRDDFRKAR